jgi:glycosyltransferase
VQIEGNMKISVVTAVKNNRDIIGDCIDSVIGQTYKNREHIIIDGGSIDGTVDIIKDYAHHIDKVVSERDKGIYDALNKGIRLATGNVVGFLNADDMFAGYDVLERIAGVFSDRAVQGFYGDLEYVSRKDPSRVIRYWRSSPYREGMMFSGWMMPHPTFYVRRSVYETFGLYDDSFRIAGDYQMIIRLLHKYGITVRYLPGVMVRMRCGGISNGNMYNMIIKSLEDMRAWETNGLKAPRLMVAKKILSKVPQFFIR